MGMIENTPKQSNIERGEKTMSDKMKTWLKAAGIRAVKTVAQTAIATIGTTAVISGVDWLVVVSASAVAGIVSVLTSLAGLPEVKEEV